MLCLFHFDSPEHVWFVFLRCTFPYILAKSDFGFHISFPVQMCPFPLIYSYSTWHALLLHIVFVRNSKNTLLRGNCWLCNILKPFGLWRWTAVTFIDVHKVFLCRWGLFSEQVAAVWPQQSRHLAFMPASSCPFECPWSVRRMSQVTKRRLLSTLSEKHYLNLVFAVSGPWWLESLSSFKVLLSSWGVLWLVTLGGGVLNAYLFTLLSLRHISAQKSSWMGEGGWDCIVGAGGW